MAERLELKGQEPEVDGGAPEGRELGAPVPVTAAAGEPSSPAPREVAWGQGSRHSSAAWVTSRAALKATQGPTALQRDVLFTQQRRTPGVLFKGRF